MPCRSLVKKAALARFMGPEKRINPNVNRRRRNVSKQNRFLSSRVFIRCFILVFINALFSTVFPFPRCRNLPLNKFNSIFGQIPQLFWELEFYKAVQIIVWHEGEGPGQLSLLLLFLTVALYSIYSI